MTNGLDDGATLAARACDLEPKSMGELATTTWVMDELCVFTLGDGPRECQHSGTGPYGVLPAGMPIGNHVKCCSGYFLLYHRDCLGFAGISGFSISPAPGIFKKIWLPRSGMKGFPRSEIFRKFGLPAPK